MELLIGGHKVLIDPADAPVLLGGRWRIWSRGYVAQRLKNEAGKREVTLLHRALLNAQPGQLVDHINGDPLDNRRANLRICTHAQNMQNRRIAKHNRSGTKGIYQKRSRWIAEICAGGIRYRLGSFTNPEDAGAAYAAASKRLHGEFSRAA